MKLEVLLSPQAYLRSGLDWPKKQQPFIGSDDAIPIKQSSQKAAKYS